MLFQQAPAETTAYLIAGYLVIIGVMLIYLISLVVRSRNLIQDYKLLKEIDEGQKEK